MSLDRRDRLASAMTGEPDRIGARVQLEEALRRREGLLITYESPGAEKPTVFLIFPKRVLQLGPHWYVDGWSALYPVWAGRGRSRRGTGGPRRFRLDRIRSVEPRPARENSILGYIDRKFASRGLIGGFWGLFLDFLVVAFFVTLAVTFLAWLWRVVSR